MCCEHSIERKSLKTIIEYGYYIFAGIGIVMIIFGFSMGYILVPFIYKNVDYNYIYDAKVYIGTLFFYEGITFFLISILAYLAIQNYQSWGLRKFLLGSYLCCGSIFCISLLVLAVISLTIVAVHSAYGQDERACVREELFRQSHRMYKKSEEILCTNQCPCLINESAEKKYTAEQLAPLQYSDKSGAINIMGCKQYEEMGARMGWEDSTRNHTDFITTLEITLDCSGICKNSPIYIFSDVNRGPPQSKKSCFEVLDENVSTWGNLFFVVSWALTLGIFFTLCAGCLLCCAKEENQQNQYIQQIQSQQYNRNGVYYQPVQQQSDEYVQQQSTIQQQQQSSHIQQQQQQTNNQSNVRETLGDSDLNQQQQPYTNSNNDDDNNNQNQ